MMTMNKKTIAGMALAAAVGTPLAVGAMTETEATQQPVEMRAEAKVQADLIECPLTGEMIPPCCCPEKNETKAKK